MLKSHYDCCLIHSCTTSHSCAAASQTKHNFQKPTSFFQKLLNGSQTPATCPRGDYRIWYMLSYRLLKFKKKGVKNYKHHHKRDWPVASEVPTFPTGFKNNISVIWRFLFYIYKLDIIKKLIFQHHYLKNPLMLVHQYVRQTVSSTYDKWQKCIPRNNRTGWSLPRSH